MTHTPPARRTGRPPLTERRKAATRLEIARAAVRLFTVHGVAATTAEQIADAAGISLRTFWRYFPAKESCVLPLLTGGVEAVVEAMHEWAPGDGVTGLMDGIERRSGDLIADLPTVMTLVGLTRTEPALRAVWLQAHDDAEPVFAAALARRSGLPGDSLEIRLRAAMFNGAIRAAVEHYAWSMTTEPVPAEAIDALRTALLTAAEALQGPRPENTPLWHGVHEQTPHQS